MIKEKIISTLTIDKGIEGSSYKTHNALLNLSGKNGQHHLITTNADRGFIEAAEKLKLRNFKVDAYPYLPPATLEDLSRPVHLHGLLEKNDPNGKNLIFTSADFGKAYLIDGLAAKFITQLFYGDFIIVFIGYSLSDPVLRYITDALAYAGRKGKVFAFAGYNNTSEGEKNVIKQQWELKGIEPILYSDENKHQQLHDMLHNWDEELKFYSRFPPFRASF